MGLGSVPVRPGCDEIRFEQNTIAGFDEFVQSAEKLELPFYRSGDFRPAVITALN
jgi:hypothetical protein